MINLCDLGRVYIVCGKTDLRKGIDGLATLAKEQFELDPFSGKVFLPLLRQTQRSLQSPLLGRTRLLATL
ncbi:IS66 family insertion sequence element accessory protein TnpB [Lactobacillus helveticus]|uniref:IS66 family insertion sequence element accessory protein TnpB n=1 Tax=Lactobacillus helveticus TaxID=1587 RepID=UPI0019FF39FC|nr:hypothetical protein [Lactobacillus helveticus]